LAAAPSPEIPDSGIVIDSPLNGTVFPPDFTRPTFLWHDDKATADQWLIFIKFGDSEGDALTILVPGEAPPQPEIDLEAISDTNSLYQGSEYQNSAKAWTPGPQLWEEIKRRSLERAARVTMMGLNSADPTTVLSSGTMVLKTSRDPVGAPIFYRDVPLMPAAGEPGKIRPLGLKAVPIIAWRLRDVSKPESKLVLKGMYSCANCHSFSSDGKTLGMDMDGPDGDKGMYALKDLEKNMSIGKDDVITWNSFPDKPEGHRTLGLFSQVSPDGRFVASTVNEDIFITNFSDYKILQVFYPTRGIIGIYSRDGKHFSSLPGADDPDYVQSNPVWSPDGKWIYFSRAKAFDAYRPGQKMPEYPNDPNEPQIRFDIWRVPFNGGKGGTPEPIAGASDNGYSNSFPKISPDNKWLVWTRCKNGMLLRPDGRLFIVPAEGGEAREMNCNTPLMNSWHSFSPNGRWMVFSSKSRTPYTQAFLTHIDENGNDSPALLIPNSTAANRAVNLPEFLNAGYDALDTIEAPVVAHHTHMMAAERSLQAGNFAAASQSLGEALNAEPTLVRALVNMGVALGKLGKSEEGLLYTEKATSVYPEDSYALFNSVLLYLDANRPGMAAKTLGRLVESAPYFPMIDDARALVDQALANLQNEISTTEAGLAQEPDSVNGNHYLSELYRRAGRLEDSLKYLQKACDLSGGNPVLQCHLAWLLATNPDDSIRDGKRALELATKAIETTRGERPEAWDVLAAAYAELGQSAKAVEAHQRATELAQTVNPRLIETWTRRARLFPEGKPLRTPRDR
jgi:tetratricopeptide (TPR) repeat protein